LAWAKTELTAYRFTLLWASGRLYRKEARKPLGLSQGRNGLSPAGDEHPTDIADFARLRENKSVGILHLTNRRMVFVGSAVNRSCG
jgi:hypothetical protein